MTIIGGTISSSDTTAYALANPLVFGSSASVTLGDPTNDGLLAFTAGGTVAANVQLTVNSPVTITGSLSGAFGLTVNGPSALTLTGSNSFTGGITLNAGGLNLNSAGAAGAGLLALSGGTLDNTSGAAVTLATNNPQLWNGSFTFNGSNPLNLGNGAVSLGAPSTVSVSAGTLTVGGPILGGQCADRGRQRLVGLKAPARSAAGPRSAAARCNWATAAAATTACWLPVSSITRPWFTTFTAIKASATASAATGA